MKILLQVQHRDRNAIVLLNAMAKHNALLMEEDPTLPLLYDSGAVYRLEEGEVWSDIVALYEQGWEDCDSLAPARAGELLARGWRAMGPEDPGYAVARRLRPTRIRAEVIMETNARPNGPGTYHCLVAYWIDGQRFIDDPSLRLGMRDGLIDAAVLQRWQKRGVAPRAPGGPRVSEPSPRSAARSAPQPRGRRPASRSRQPAPRGRHARR